MSFLKKANEAFKQQDYKKAIDLYNQITTNHPVLAKNVEFNLRICEEKLTDKVVPKLPEEQEKNTFKTYKSASSKYEGKLESYNNNQLKGWAVRKSGPGDIFELTIQVDGVQFCTLKNNQNRGDLQRHKKSLGLGGFSIQLPSELFSKSMHTIDILLPDGKVLGQINVRQKTLNTALHQSVRIPVKESVSVIVPIYNAAEDLVVCIDRLIKYTKPNVDIVLIDDASSDNRIQPILEKAKVHKNIRVYTNKKNLGFTRTVNRGIKLAENNDVVFLNSDARVTPRWLEGMQTALMTDAKIATVTPMSDRAGAFSAPNIGNENDLPDGVREEDYAVAFRRRSFGFYPTVPTGNGFCLYVRRSCINEIGALDEDAFPRGYGEENDFCMRARAAGWRNVIDDRTYVFHDRNKSFGEAKTDLMAAGRKIVDERYPDYKKSTSVFTQSTLINLARFRAREALKDSEDVILPRGLFVISTLTGGTPQTNRDLMLTVNTKIEPWLLHCDSKVISLFKVHSEREDALIEQYILKEEIEPLTHTSSEYDMVVASWLSKYDFELVHIRHLAWQSLNLPALAKTAGARVIMSFHDYYALCPTVKLLDNERKYCGGKCTSSKGECIPELWKKDAFPYLKDSWVHIWRSKLREAVKDCDIYITTHQSAKDTIVEHLGVDEKKFHVIPHGRDFKEFYQLAEPYKKGDVLKILVPGNINDAKGSQVIADLLKLDRDGLLQFHILGRVAGDLSQLNHSRLIIHGEYKRDDFAEHVKNIKPHIGAVLSIWNETWCHTLTELWSVGLPVIVTDYDTIAKRVAQSGAGWVFSESNTSILYSEIVEKVMDKSNYSQAIKYVYKHKEMLQKEDRLCMAEKYNKVYFLDA